MKPDTKRTILSILSFAIILVMIIIVGLAILNYQVEGMTALIDACNADPNSSQWCEDMQTINRLSNQ
jgi:uncharacterized membrane protein YkgB